MNSKIQEYDFLVSILSDLRNNYKGHNKEVLSHVLAVCSFNKAAIEKSEIERMLNGKAETTSV